MIDYNLRVMITFEKKFLDQYLSYREEGGTLTYPEYLVYKIKVENSSNGNKAT